MAFGSEVKKFIKAANESCKEEDNYLSFTCFEGDVGCSELQRLI